MIPNPLANAVVADPDETEAIARRLAPHLGPGDVVCLEGPLGAGKTHFARAVISELTGESEIPSPTYTLVQTYSGPSCEIWHADLYRLGDAGEVEELGLTEAFDTAIVLIEWPDRLNVRPPALDLQFHLQTENPSVRRITARGSETRWARRIGAAFEDHASHV